AAGADLPAGAGTGLDLPLRVLGAPDVRRADGRAVPATDVPAAGRPGRAVPGRAGLGARAAPEDTRPVDRRVRADGAAPAPLGAHPPAIARPALVPPHREVDLRAPGGRGVLRLHARPVALLAGPP